MILLGVDPGLNTGLVTLLVPKLKCKLEEIVFCSHDTVVRPGSSKKVKDEVDRDIRFYDLLAQAVSDKIRDTGDFATDVVYSVIENPDVSATWQRFSRLTDHRLGVYAGLALAAVRPHSEVVVRVPVVGTTKNPGWIRGRKTETVMFETMVQAKAFKAPWKKMTEHERSALGLLLWFLRQHKDS